VFVGSECYYIIDMLLCSIFYFLCSLLVTKDIFFEFVQFQPKILRNITNTFEEWNRYSFIFVVDDYESFWTVELFEVNGIDVTGNHYNF
jgi:hypothetical protein